MTSESLTIMIGPAHPLGAYQAVPEPATAHGSNISTLVKLAKKRSKSSSSGAIVGITCRNLQNKPTIT